MQYTKRALLKGSFALMALAALPVRLLDKNAIYKKSTSERKFCVDGAGGFASQAVGGGVAGEGL